MKQKGRKISGRAWGMLAFLFTLTVICNVDKAIIGFASVPIMEELKLTPEQWGIVGSSFFLLYSLSAILVGGLSDRIGTKKVIAGMAAVWAIVQFATLWVVNLPYLLITRIILGAGEGPAYALAMTAASKWLPKERLGFGLTLVSIGGPLGIAMTAPVLMHLIGTYGWRSAFVASALVGVIWIVLWLLLTKEGPGDEEARVEKQEKVSSLQPEPKFSSILLSKNFILLALCGFATYWAFTIGLNWLPNYLANARQLSAEQMTIVVALPWILITISQLTFSTISDRLYSKTKSVVKSRIFILGPVMLAGALFYFLGTLVSSNVLAIALLSLGFTFGCITLVMGPAILVDFVSAKNQGKIQGWFMAISSLGGIVGSYATGSMIQNSSSVMSGFHLAFQVCSVLLLVFGGLVWIAVRPKDRKESSDSLLNQEEAVS
jgi:MFS transporter, ACS family, hexuronate transporter